MQDSNEPAPGTPGWLRSRNDAQALALLLDRGALTRAELGTLTGLSKPTAAQMVSRLEQLGLVGPVGEAPARRGPAAITYGARVERARALAVDLREDALEATVVDALDTDHPVVTVPLTAADRSPQGDIQAALTAATAAAEVDPTSVRAVVIGVQAAVDVEGDVLSLTDTLPGWPLVGARSTLAHEFGLRVVIDNDVNLAAVAERQVGCAQDAGDFALLWLGDGVGVAVDVAGTVHRGASGRAGEIGYLSAPVAAAQIDPEASDLTDLLGRNGLDRLLTRLGAPDLEAALTGPDGQDALDELATRIALGTQSVLAVLDPQLVVLGGPTGLTGGQALAQAVAARIAADSRWHPDVRPGAVTTHPVLVGARRLAVGLARELLLDTVSTTSFDRTEGTAR
ncbi:MAG: ROK family transcriptional regulator [Cellulomonas sp.]|nr:ROK family transcriptional regulator [Actinomycetota bacterium]MCG2799672.1 ROK family transcriptional regulator [Cellulomonas sp.]